MQKFKQFVYYAEGSANNTYGIDKTKLINGDFFSGNNYTLSQLGIQAPPGTKFFVNTGGNPVIIGSTGLFQLDLTTGCSITNLQFERKSIEFIESNPGAYLIIDMAYEGGIS